MMNFLIYDKGPTIKLLSGFTPLVAQWEKNSHPAQVRLHRYLAWLQGELARYIENENTLFLDLEIDVVKDKNLLNRYDLENFLTPLFSSRCLDAHQFVLVFGRKKVGGGSSLAVGKAVSMTGDHPYGEWQHFNCSPGAGAGSKAWKERIRAALEMSAPEVIGNEPIEVQLAWQVGPRRNWVNLWKPTGDAMGPVLGYVKPGNLYHPHDDRIVHLIMHKTVDRSMDNEVEVGIWWRKANQ